MHMLDGWIKSKTKAAIKNKNIDKKILYPFRLGSA